MSQCHINTVSLLIYWLVGGPVCKTEQITITLLSHTIYSIQSSSLKYWRSCLWPWVTLCNCQASSANIPLTSMVYMVYTGCILFSPTFLFETIWVAVNLCQPFVGHPVSLYPSISNVTNLAPYICKSVCCTCLAQGPPSLPQPPEPSPASANCHPRGPATNTGLTLWTGEDIWSLWPHNVTRLGPD